MARKTTDISAVDWRRTPYVVVGAGLWGSTIAERIANGLKKNVLVIEKRGHPGGNCYSRVHPQTGIEYHLYGTHIFHTSSPRVLQYIRRFTELNSYRHQVLTTYKDRVFQMPINLETINAFYGLNLKPFEVAAFLKTESAKDRISSPRNLEEQAVSRVGRRLYEAFIRGYTRKQWQRDPRDLPASVIDRLPVRTNYDESYYHDRWQGIPEDGYGRIFTRMLASPRIRLCLNCDFFAVREMIPREVTLFYSGPLDQFFDFRFGRLPWRSLELTEEVVPVEDYQGTSVMNYAQEKIPYTRIHEPRHLHPERSYPKDRTLIVKEYPREGLAEQDPCYPLDSPETKAMLKRYLALRRRLRRVIMGGRLADYAYYDMDRVIGSALDVYETKVRGVQEKASRKPASRVL